MHVIVILDVASITLVYLTNETRKFSLVHLRQLVDSKHLKDMNSQYGKSSLSSKVTTELKSVEFYSISLSKMLLVLLNVVVNRI